jgi:hypothetical protein
MDVDDMDFVWERPVLVFYREKHEEPEREAFAVVKARRLIFDRGAEGPQFNGSIQDFFPLMGDIDYISSEEGLSDQYVMCWFDDEADFDRSWRRLTGVIFPKGVNYETDERGKRTYNADFKADREKLD